MTTYVARLPLPLGNTPQVDEDKDPELYKELLDIHDSITNTANGLELTTVVVEDNSTQFRSVTNITPAASPYVVLTTDGLIRVDASAGDVDIILPNVTNIKGFEFKVKRVDAAPSTNSVNLTGAVGQLVDGHVAGVAISPLSSYTVKATDNGYDII